MRDGRVARRNCPTTSHDGVRSGYRSKGVPRPLYRPQPGLRRRIALVSSISLAGAMALSLAVAAPSGASTKHAASTTSTTLKSLESTLKSMEVAPSSSTTISEAGSSLFYPLYKEWSGASPYSTLTIQPAAGGSGAGVTAAINGTVNIGASDPFLSPAQAAEGVINIPTVVAGQAVNYNLPGLKAGVHLRLNSTVLAGIYSGAITTWNNKAIEKLNPGVKIPGNTIVTIHRSDSSGDTFLFTSYINDGDSSSFLSALGGPANSISWPNVSGALAASGNSGMLSTLENTPGGIAYIGLSYLRQALAANLGYALLQNGRGNFVGPTVANINNEVSVFTSIPSNGAISLEYSKAKAAANGYPDVNFEYSIVKTSQPNGNTAAVIKSLLAWAMDPTGGATSQFLTQLYFLPLPANALKVAIGLLNSI